MRFIEDLENKISNYMDGMYEVIELDYIPNIENVAIGKKAYKVEVCAFSMDMRGSSDLLFNR